MSCSFAIKLNKTKIYQQSLTPRLCGNVIGRSDSSVKLLKGLVKHVK